MVCWSAGQNKRFIKNRGYWQRAGLGSPLTQEDELYLVFKRYNMVSFKAMRLVERGGPHLVRRGRIQSLWRADLGEVERRPERIDHLAAERESKPALNHNPPA